MCVCVCVCELVLVFVLLIMSKVIYYIVFIYLVSFWLLFCFKTKTIIEIVAVFGKYLIQSLFLFNKPGKYDKNNNNNNSSSSNTTNNAQRNKKNRLFLLKNCNFNLKLIKSLTQTQIHTHTQ